MHATSFTQRHLQQEKCLNLVNSKPLCLQQDERPNLSVMPEEAPEQQREPQCPESVCAEESNTAKVDLVSLETAQR